MLSLNLFGEFEAWFDQQPLHFRTDKIRALLAYLVLTSPYPQPRAKLAVLLWGEQPSGKAFGNLRASLLRLRESLAPWLAVDPDALVITQRTVAFNTQTVWADVLAFDALLNAGDTHMADMAQAVALYRGPLLQHLTLSDSPAFDDWLSVQSQTRHQRALAALHTLALNALAHQKYEAAHQHAQHLIQLDPLREEGHRLAMLAWQQRGDVAAALAHYESYRQLLGEELSLAPSTELAVLAQHLRAQQTHRETTPPAPVHHNLPAPLNALIGREQAVAELVNLISQPAKRLMSLVGTGGVGKTRLALSVAHQLVGGRAFPDGVWWCELGGLTQPAHIVPTLVNVLGLHERDSQSHLALLQSSLKGRRALLILDNCEHLIADCARLIEVLLLSSPDLKIVVTSRESLNLAGEWVWRVPSLTFHKSPASALRTGALDLDEIAQTESVRLFVDRAMQMAPTFKLNADNIPFVAQLCERLDGIPLALELAAARIKVMPVQQIAARLADRFALLSEGKRTAPQRQQTLRAALEWSHDLLDEPERVLLRRLSVFQGGWALADAEAVCGAGLADERVFDVLTRLVDKSLVVLDSSHAHAPRYRMLETIREYGGLQLRNSGEAYEMHERHLRYFVQWAEDAERQINTRHGKAVLGRFAQEYDNLRGALGWACQHDLETARVLAGLLHWFWFHGDYLSEALEWYARVLDGAGPVPVTRGRALVLLGAGTLATFFNRLDEAQTYLEESISLWRQFDEPWRLGWAYYRLIYVLIQRGEVARATSLCAECEPLFRSTHDGLLLGLALGWWAKALIDLEGPQRNHVLITSLLNEAVAIGNALQDARGLFAPHQIWGYWAQACGELGVARHHFLESLHWRRHWGTRWVIVAGLRDVAHVLSAQGDYVRAKPYYTEALGLARELGDQGAETEISQHLAEVDLRLHLGHGNSLDLLQKSFQSLGL